MIVPAKDVKRLAQGRQSLADVGVRPRNKYMNKEARPLTQEQRKEFVQLLKDRKDRLIQNLSNRYSKRYSNAWDAAIKGLIENLGAGKLYEKVQGAKKELKDSEKSLTNLGFHFDTRGQLALTSEGRDKHEESLEERREQLLEEEVETVRKKFEMAILNVLATENVEEAKGVVEPLV
jgi:Spy/CpxP family protein refolding chaperone